MIRFIHSSSGDIFNVAKSVSVKRPSHEQFTVHPQVHVHGTEVQLWDFKEQKQTTKKVKGPARQPGQESLDKSPQQLPPTVESTENKVPDEKEILQPKNNTKEDLEQSTNEVQNPVRQPGQESVEQSPQQLSPTVQSTENKLPGEKKNWQPQINTKEDLEKLLKVVDALKVCPGSGIAGRHGKCRKVVRHAKSERCFMCQQHRKSLQKKQRKSLTTKLRVQKKIKRNREKIYRLVKKVNI